MLVDLCGLMTGCVSLTYGCLSFGIRFVLCFVYWLG